MRRSSAAPTGAGRRAPELAAATRASGGTHTGLPASPSPTPEAETDAGDIRARSLSDRCARHSASTFHSVVQGAAQVALPQAAGPLQLPTSRAGRAAPTSHRSAGGAR